MFWVLIGAVVTAVFAGAGKYWFMRLDQLDAAAHGRDPSSFPEQLGSAMRAEHPDLQTYTPSDLRLPVFSNGICSLCGKVTKLRDEPRFRKMRFDRGHCPKCGQPYKAEVQEPSDIC